MEDSGAPKLGSGKLNDNNAVSLNANDLASCPTGACGKKENIIIVAAEHSYNSFWLKMMFMTCGYAVAKGKLTPPNYSRSVDITTVIVINYGYTELERTRIGNATIVDIIGNGAFSHIANEVIMIKTRDQLLNVIKNRNKNGSYYKIKNIVVFSHGLPLYIPLNYKGDPDINIDDKFIDALNKDMFTDDAIFFSYACRTGSGISAVQSESIKKFNTDPERDNSLAQYIANKLKITVRAYYRRTDYGVVLGSLSKSKEISNAMQRLRDSGMEGRVLDLSNEFEALPHSGLSYNWKNNIKGWIGKGPVGERVAGYSLWRKQGAVKLPPSSNTPNYPPDYATFKPM